MFCCAAFVLGSIGQEFVRGTRARMAMRRRGPARGAARARRAQPPALRRLHRAPRAWPCCSSGVAASTSFQHVVELGLSPGQSARVGGYNVRYVRPTAAITPRYDPAHTGATLNLGALLDVTQGGPPRRNPRTERGLLRLPGSRAGQRRPLDRRHRRESRRDEREPHARRVERRRARHQHTPPAAHRRARQPHDLDQPARRGHRGDRRDGARIHARPAPRAVQADRLAAGDVDLDRRPHRLRAAA